MLEKMYGKEFGEEEENGIKLNDEKERKMGKTFNQNTNKKEGES